MHLPQRRVVPLHAPILPHGGSLDADLLSVGVTHDAHSTCATPVHDSGRVHSRANVPARTAACGVCGGIVVSRTCPVRGDYTDGSYSPVRPLVHSRAAMCARACVTWAGGALTGRAWPVQNAKGADSVRRRQVAAPSGPAAVTPMVPRLPPAPQPAQATACGSACRSSE
jgi:hypothetical protein